MTQDYQAFVKTDDLPIRHAGEVVNGRVRTVYWLNNKDSSRLASQYQVNADLGFLITSDRNPIYGCTWQSESGLTGIPGKGASLNLIHYQLFRELEGNGLKGHHLIESFHPNIWLVKKEEQPSLDLLAEKYLNNERLRDYHEYTRLLWDVKVSVAKGLLQLVPDKDLLVNNSKEEERREFAKTFKIPDDVYLEAGRMYVELARKIIKKQIELSENPREKIIHILDESCGVIEK